MKKILSSTLALLLSACSLQALPKLTPILSSTAPATLLTASPSPMSGPELPPVLGPDPSHRVAAFYYPWYGNPAVDGEWIHWTQAGNLPPGNISSDYYPALGAYSSNDPAVVAQHMAWLRQAGVGVIAVSWWGQGCREERPVPLILQMAQRYGIQVTFHIEPYSGRTAEGLVSDVEYLYKNYASHPAFFRTTASSRYSPGDQPKPMFFVWAIEVPDTDKAPVQADYWRKAMDAIHALPEGGLVIANTLQADWIQGGHFDGLYNYASLHLDQNDSFDWARSLPTDSLYIPSVIPGFSAKRIGYSADTYVPRENGDTFAGQWTAALGTGVEPAMVTITSFNEWHEGTMIEPPATGVDNSQGVTYADFAPLPPDGYLTLTRQWVDKFLATDWQEQPAHRVRLQIMTTSDWTTLNIASGGAWMHPELVSASPGATQAGIEGGERFVLMQSLKDAETGKQVQMTWDLELTGLDPAGTLVLNIERGNLGGTQVTVFNYLGEAPVAVKTIRWAAVTTGRNSLKAEIPSSSLTNPVP